MRRRGTPSNVVQLSDYQREIRRDRAALREVEAEIISLEAARARREAEQVHGAALRENVEWHRAQIAALEGRGAGSPPSAAIRARKLQEAAQRAREAAKRAAADALAWRQAHPMRAALADRAGIALGVDQAAAEAQAAAQAAAAAYKRSPLLIEAQRWLADNRALRALQERLPAVERAAGIEPQAERDARARAALDDAARALRRAAGRIENDLMRATEDESRELFEMREEIRAELEQIEELREELPEPAEAESRRDSAMQRLEQAEGWRAVAAEARAAAEAEAAQRQAAARLRSADAPAPSSPRPRGPRMG